jgi:hypothetical protein
MSETPQPTADEAGIPRTPTGEIVDPTAKTPVDQTTQEPKSDETKTDTKAKEDGKSLLNDDATKAAKPEGAPESYEAFKVPEGFELDEAVAKEVGDLFKGLNLPQDAAQKLVDFYTAKTQESAEAPFKLWRETQDRWVSEIKADPEIGGKLDQVKATVAKAIDGLGDAKLATDFREAMDYTGAGNNPAFIRAFYRLAQKVVEPGHVAGNAPSKFGQANPGRPESAARALYPNLS